MKKHILNKQSMITEEHLNELAYGWKSENDIQDCIERMTRNGGQLAPAMLKKDTRINSDTK